MKPKVLCLIPRAGLGNQLLTWAKGLAYAKRYNLELLHTGWSLPSKTRVQRILRGNETWISCIKGDSYGRLLLARASTKKINIIYEPSQQNRPDENAKLIIFNKVPSWQDFFKDFRDMRAEIISELHKIIRNKAANTLMKLVPPQVVVHMRMGDFKTIAPGINFDNVGGYRTPLRYFQNVIQGIRTYAKAEIPIHIVSDGRPTELTEILKYNNIYLVPQRPAIVDILWMSKAKIIVASAGSTFSFWAAFLGEASILHHPSHVPIPIRPRNSVSCFDGPASEDFQKWPQDLITSCKQLKTAANTP